MARLSLPKATIRALTGHRKPKKPFMMYLRRARPKPTVFAERSTIRRLITSCPGLPPRMLQVPT